MNKEEIIIKEVIKMIDKIIESYKDQQMEIKTIATVALGELRIKLERKIKK